MKKITGWWTRFLMGLAMFRHECVYVVMRGKSLRTAHIEAVFSIRADAEDHGNSYPPAARAKRFITPWSVIAPLPIERRMFERLRFRLAEIVSVSLSLLCVLTNHAFGCWPLRVFRPLDHWAFEIVYAADIRRKCEQRVKDLLKGVSYDDDDEITGTVTHPVYTGPRQAMTMTTTAGAGATFIWVPKADA